MRFSTILPMLLAAGVANAQFGQNKGGNGQNGQNKGGNGQNNGQNGQNNGGNNGQNNGGGNGGNVLALNPNNVQKNSNTNGQAAGAEAGQAASATDPANFINFCTGKTITNGLQVKTGSCNGIVMGDIPASTNMISAIFTNPKDGDKIAANQAIKFSVKIANLQAGSFTNPDVTYYAAPQALNGGKVIGHTHVTVQDMGNAATNPPDAQTFAFFKGINDAGDGQGTLSADLAKGLPAGSYRVCSMTSSSNHQPVLMPVAQRGAQDDCVRFTVANGGGNGGNNGQNGGQNNGQQGGQQGQQGAKQGQQGQQGGQQGQQGGQQGQQGAKQGQQGQGQGGKRFGRPKFAARAYIA